LFDKLNRNQSIVVGIFGGSMTAGIGCFDKKSGALCSWPTRFERFLQSTFPSAQIRFEKFCCASCDSTVALTRLEDHISGNHTHLDLIIVDTSLNDRHSYDIVGTNVTLFHVSESIIRLGRLHHMAVFYLSTYMGSSTAVDDIYGEICAFYGVPLISYRRAVLPEILLAESSKTFDPLNGTLISPFYSTELSRNYPHPFFQTHIILAQYLAHIFMEFFTSYLNSPRNSAIETHIGKSRYGPPIEEMTDDDNPLFNDITCSPVLKTYSSLKEEENDPHSKDSSSMIGWELRADRPNKPIGWIVNGSFFLSSQQIPQLQFQLKPLKGRVTITYLKSYFNAGKFLVYFRSSSWLEGSFRTTSKTKQRTHPNMIPCCRMIPPHIATHSAVIDTYSNASKASGLFQHTLHFDLTAMTMPLVIEHIQMPQDEVLQRGGDQVKILSVKSC
jgi:hypothetical protein